MATYQKWSFLLPGALEGIFSAELWSRGVLGVEIRPRGEAFEGVRFDDEPADSLEIDAFFDDPAPEAALTLDAASWAERGVVRTDSGVFADQDWLAVYRRSAQPIDVGDRFRLDPREPESSAPSVSGTSRVSGTPRVEDGRFVLQLPARTAFGTGSHESTRLVLRCLENLADDGRLAGRSVLDVGTGSGVLAFAAVLLGAGPVVGYDLDPEALWMAGINGRLNGLTPQFFAGRPGTLRSAARFDVLLVNVLPERICDDLPGLVGHLASGGQLISSGNLAAQRAPLLERFANLGLEPTGEAVENEWVAWVLEHRNPGNGGP